MNLDLLLTRRRTIIPATPEDAERLVAIPSDSLLPVLVKLVRNAAHHKRFEALVRFVVNNHPRIHGREQLLAELKVRTGLCTPIYTKGGGVCYELGSIAHDKMDEGEFREWSGKARQLLKDEYFPGIEERELDVEVRRELDQWERWA